MKQVTRKKVQRSLLFILVLILYGVFFAVSFSRMNKSLFYERSSNTSRLMEKITQNVQTGIQVQWDNLRWIVNMLPDSGTMSMEDFLNEIDETRQECPSYIPFIYAIDDQSICHVPQGRKFRWGKPELLNSGKEECYISESELRISNDDTPYMFFLYPLGDSYLAGEKKITHIGISVEMTFMDEFFNTEEYGSESIAFILRRSGGQIYRQKKTNQISSVFNVLTALEQAEYSYDASHDQLIQDMENGKAGCIRASYEGEMYFIAYDPMKTNGWMTLLMIPEKNIGTANQEFVVSLAINILAITLGASAIVIYVLWEGSKRISQRHEEINAQLQKAVDAERNANDAKTRFLSSMSHDIRTPMNAIIGMTELASRHIQDTEYARSCLSKASLACNHLLTLINDVLDVSKVESGKMTLNPFVFSLADTVFNLVNITYPQIVSKGQEFDLRLHHIQREIVFADQLRINQVLINILSNAVKYTPEGGRITMDVKEHAVPNHPDRIRLEFVIEDNGMGMSKEFQQTMYSAFSRADDIQTANIQGTGLGLTICKQMVEVMGGTIECESELGKGTRFVINLELDAEEKVPSLMQHPEIHLLLIDADPVFLETGAWTLHQLGIHVSCAGCIEEAVSCLERHTCNVIVADWYLSCGKEEIMAESLRQLAPDSYLFFSSYAPEDIEESAKTMGADGVLAKPFFLSVLNKKLADLFGMKHEEERKKPHEKIDLAGIHLLVAEDNDMNWEIANALLGMYGVTADRAENGQICVEMLEKAPAGTYRMILMDIQMPIMNGYGAARMIRSHSEAYIRNIPIIAMTADAFSDDIQRCLDAGMNAHVSKPINIENLLAVLGEQIDLR